MKKKRTPNSKLKSISPFELIGVIAIVSIVVSLIGWQIFLRQFNSNFYPGVTIDGFDVGGLTKTEAAELLEEKHQSSLVQSVVAIHVDDIEVASSSSQLGLHRDYTTALETAYEVGRARSGLLNTIDIIRAFHARPAFSTKLTFEQTQVDKLISELKKKVDVLGRDPSASLGATGAAWSLEIDPGSIGREVQHTKTLDAIMANASENEINLEAPVASTASELSEEALEQARERALHLVGSSLIFRADGITITLNDTDLVELLQLPAGYADQEIASLVDSWGETVNRPPQDAVFEYNPETLEVAEFKPDRPGLELQAEEAKTLLINQLSELESELIPAEENATETTEPKQLEAFLPVTETEPSTPLASTNDLGINTLIGFGESYYDHSIPSRIHNVSHTTEKIANHIIAPGEEFSFNKTLGEVSSRTGFKPAYVIKGGRTELGDGGGVCQVSTTLFRSVLDAGLPVTKRKPHSYRVSYYEQGFKPGIDATVYSGDVDLRFINDTGHYILITGAADSENLYMTVELYGTSDGRTTEITNHKTWGYSPPLAPQYINDPSLPSGAIRQIDWAASGIKASFKNIVRDKDGNVIREEEYTSNYRPWAAKYLRGV